MRPALSRTCLGAIGWTLAALAAPGMAYAQDTSAPAAAFSTDAVLTVDALSNTRGGLKQGSWGQWNLDLTASWSGPKGWDAFGYVLVDGHGGFSSRYVGDAQGVSNIDAPAAARLFEAWMRHTSDDSHHITTFGVINLNGIFDTQPTGTIFLNSSNGIGPDYSQAGPSIFPFSGLGIVEEWRPADTVRWRAGVFDGQPGNPNHPDAFAALSLHKSEGLHLVTELELDNAQGFIKLGAWSYTAVTPRIDGAGDGHRQGAYAQLGMTLTREAGDPDQGLSGWLRIGAAAQSVLDISDYAGGGLTYTGPLPGRDHDLAGLAVSRIRYGQASRQLNGLSGQGETTVEATYQYEVRPGTIIQPDIQWVHTPSGDRQTRDALVIGIRFRHDFGI